MTCYTIMSANDNNRDKKRNSEHILGLLKWLTSLFFGFDLHNSSKSFFIRLQFDEKDKIVLMTFTAISLIHLSLTLAVVCQSLALADCWKCFLVYCWQQYVTYILTISRVCSNTKHGATHNISLSPLFTSLEIIAFLCCCTNNEQDS